MSDTNNKKTEPDAPKNSFQAGEKGFAVFWLLFGLFFLYQSLKLYEKTPGISSAAAVPLFCSGVIVLCAIVIILSDRKAVTPNSGKPIGTQFRQTLKNIFPTDISVMILLILLYCIGLYIKLGFYVCTPVFLWVGMMWFMRKKFVADGFDKKAFVKCCVSNLIWTAICIAFILVMFSYLFRVVLP